MPEWSLLLDPMFGLSDYLAAVEDNVRYPVVWGGHYRDGVRMSSLFHGAAAETDHAIYEALLPLALTKDVTSAALVVNDFIHRKLYHGSFLVTETGWATELHIGSYQVDDYGKLVVSSSAQSDWMTDLQHATIDALARHRTRYGGDATLEAALMAAIQYKHD